MYYSDESSGLGECIWTTLLMGAILYFSYTKGRTNAYKEIEDKNQNDRIMSLESELEQLKRQERIRTEKIRSDWGCNSNFS